MNVTRYSPDDRSVPVSSTARANLAKQVAAAVQVRRRLPGRPSRLANH